MNLNRKVIESITVAASVAVMSTFTAFAGPTEDNTKTVEHTVAVDANGTAGIIEAMKQIELSAVNSSGYLEATLEKVQNNMVAAGNGQAGTEAALQQETETQKAEETPQVTAGAANVSAEAILEIQNTQTQTVEPENVVPEKEMLDTEVLPETETTGTQDSTEIPPESEPDAVEAESKPEPETGLELSENQPEAEEAENVQPDEGADTVVMEGEEGSEAQPETKEGEVQQPQEEEQAEWSDKLMANVEESMNVRTEPSEDAELAGKLFKGDVAQVMGNADGWTQITSGNVTGYVKNDYCVYGADAYNLANEVCTVYATAETGGLRLRSEPSAESSILKTAAEGDKLVVDKEVQAVDGWVPVEMSDQTAYVSAEYVDIALNTGTGLTMDEVKAKEEAKAKEEGKKKAAMSASNDELTLLGALIQCEAGNGSYEGMVAVGAVVMNRVRSGAYPGTISGVIYQSGQFPPALSGSVANVAAGGVRSSCMQAAQAAISGTDNTGGALSFRSASSGAGGTVIGANVFF